MVVSEKVVLKRLMPPLVEALGCSEGLVTLALHTLEYWVDSLNPEFLEPAMLPVIGELMRALWTHLRPVQDSQFGAKVRDAAAPPMGCCIPVCSLRADSLSRCLQDHAADQDTCMHPQL